MISCHGKKGHKNAPLQGDGAKNKNGKMPGDSPGNPQLIKKVRIIGAQVFYGIFSCPGKTVSIILSVTPKQEFSVFLQD